LSNKNEALEAKAGSWTFKEWYERNKPEFNARRRERYTTDPEYRKRVLEMNRKNREKRQKVVSKEDRDRKAAIKFSPAPSWKEFEGADGVTMVTIGALAKLLNRSAQSIRLWEKHNVIPATTHRNSRGDRLYSPEQVMEIKAIIKKSRNIDAPPKETVVTMTSYEIRKADGTVETMPLFRVGALAKAVNRTVLTLEQMERKGTFPETPFRDPNSGHRYYSVGMIESVKAALYEMGGSRLRGDFRKTEFRERILSDWKAQGVIGATIVGERTHG
jgi:DNA-binding transcriptional MerR regulator